MLILRDLRFPGCLMSGRTGFSLRFVAFLRRPARWSGCTAPSACRPYSAREAGSTGRLIALAADAADGPDLLPPAARARCGCAVRRVRPAVTLPAWGDLRRSPRRVACTASRPR